MQPPDFDYERMKALSAFIRAQASLPDSHTFAMGPGSVTLNHEEALLAACAIDACVAAAKRVMKAIEYVDGM